MLHHPDIIYRAAAERSEQMRRESDWYRRCLIAGRPRDGEIERLIQIRRQLALFRQPEFRLRKRWFARPTTA